MEITLLGTGDTTGTPTVGCGCATCRAAADRGLDRSRFSVHVRNERTDEAVLIDASPDFRAQFLAHDVALPDAIVITHIHFDHLDGLGNAYRVFPADDPVSVYAAGAVDPATGESVAATVRSKYAYLDRIAVEPVEPLVSRSVCGLDLTLVPVEHPPLASYGVVVRDPETGATLSITGDTTYAIPAESREALAAPDLLLADAIVPAEWCLAHDRGADYDDAGRPRTFGGKHLTREGALALADELDATRTRLVHVSHFYPVEEAFAPPLALDGERFTL